MVNKVNLIFSVICMSYIFFVAFCFYVSLDGWSFLMAFTLSPFIISAVIVYQSLLKKQLRPAWGYCFFIGATAVAALYGDLLLAVLTDRYPRDGQYSFIWIHLAILHGMSLFVATAIAMVSNLVIDKVGLK